MKILLTGSGGFTGRHVTAAATAAGHTVTPLRVDLRDPDAVAGAVAANPSEAVLHLAAVSFVGHADAAAFYAVNVVGTGNLLAALAGAASPPRRVILASSANIYGNCAVSPIGETQPPAPTNHYAISKLAMEYLARTYRDRLSILIARPFNYTGPGQGSQFVIPKLVEHFARRAPYVELGNLDVEREFNDVRLIGAAYGALLAAGEPGEVYNLCSGRPYTLRAVIALLTELTGHRLEVRVNPQFVRAGEVRRLCGDPAKLQALGARAAIALHQPDLRDTLAWMLETERAALAAGPVG